jgi:hypothetical protein
MAFKQWRNPAKTFDSSQSSQESFKSPELKTQSEDLENKTSTSRGVEIYEGRAGDYSKTQSVTSKSSNAESSETSSEESDGESDHMVVKEIGKAKPTSVAAHAKEAKLKGQEFF